MRWQVERGQTSLGAAAAGSYKRTLLRFSRKTQTFESYSPVGDGERGDVRTTSGAAVEEVRSLFCNDMMYVGCDESESSPSASCEMSLMTHLRETR